MVGTRAVCKKLKSTEAICAKCIDAMHALDNPSISLDTQSRFHGIKVVARVLLVVAQGSSIESSVGGRRDYKKLKVLISAFGKK
jgi:hypothetical protein